MSDKEFVIPFVGLKQGVHEFNFEIGKAFFESIEYSIVLEGNVYVTFLLDKKETMLIGDYTIRGTVKASCGRCNDPVDVDVEGEFQLVYKFDDKPSEDESLVIVYPEEYEIDVKESIHEFISVSIPSRTVHKEGECNEDVMKILSEYQVFTLNEDGSVKPDEEYDDWDSDEEEDDTADNGESENEPDEDTDQKEDEDQNGDDDYIDPRWNALKGLNK
ncbi:MAG: DUF177 domain-containing protein [Crocinitomicaceae bacterium]|nr:DUF177 domain-containing protein [Crocinitomicaceae bacterium]|tara:strand:+ start:23312 stop:23962 length:651 start_codon:yes stop_codon:yes gene_type:complete